MIFVFDTGVNNKNRASIKYRGLDDWSSGIRPFVDGQTHKIEIQCLSGKYEIRVDGTSACSYTDPKFLTRPELADKNCYFFVGAECGLWSNVHSVQNIVLQAA
jgi:hypothetical protein